jgi:hypothetical protein
MHRIAIKDSRKFLDRDQNLDNDLMVIMEDHDGVPLLNEFRGWPIKQFFCDWLKDNTTGAYRHALVRDPDDFGNHYIFFECLEDLALFRLTFI